MVGRLVNGADLGNLWRMRSTARCRVLQLTAVALAIACGLTACGGNPAAPSPTDEHPRLTVRGDRVVPLEPGQTVTLSVDEMDASGRAIQNPPNTYTWTSSAPGVVTAEGGVLRAGSDLGQATVSVRSAGGLSANVLIWVQPPPGAPSTFRITLHFGPDVPERWRQAIRNSASRWERVIRDELPEAPLDGVNCRQPGPPLAGIERGVSLYIVVSDTFDVDATAEAVASPCAQRPLPSPTTILGRIAINRREMEGIGTGRLNFVALHEMGHTLGLVGLVEGAPWEWFDFRTGAYSGPFGLEGYRREFGADITEIITRGAHWPFTGDVMGGLNNRISAVSVGGLMDLGYPAAWYAAE